MSHTSRRNSAGTLPAGPESTISTGTVTCFTATKRPFHVHYARNAKVSEADGAHHQTEHLIDGGIGALTDELQIHEIAKFDLRQLRHRNIRHYRIEANLGTRAGATLERRRINTTYVPWANYEALTGLHCLVELHQCVAMRVARTARDEDLVLELHPLPQQRLDAVGKEDQVALNVNAADVELQELLAQVHF